MVRSGRIISKIITTRVARVHNLTEHDNQQTKKQIVISQAKQSLPAYKVNIKETNIQMRLRHIRIKRNLLASNRRFTTNSLIWIYQDHYQCKCVNQYDPFQTAIIGCKTMLHPKLKSACFRRRLNKNDFTCDLKWILYLCLPMRIYYCGIFDRGSL